MSRAEDRREEALHCLDAVDVLRDNGGDGSIAHAALASEATAHALLAIEGRLGEIAERLGTANVIAAFQCGAIDGGADYRQARETVRRLLELPTEEV